jgi:hypothetical protein
MVGCIGWNGWFAGRLDGGIIVGWIAGSLAVRLDGGMVGWLNLMCVKSQLLVMLWKLVSPPPTKKSLSQPCVDKNPWLPKLHCTPLTPHSWPWVGSLNCRGAFALLIFHRNTYSQGYEYWSFDTRNLLHTQLTNIFIKEKKIRPNDGRQFYRKIRILYYCMYVETIHILFFCFIPNFLVVKMLICATYSLVRYACTVCVKQKERPKMYQLGGG